MTMELPKGITHYLYKSKQGKQVKFRVVKTIRGNTLNKLFDTLDEAEKALIDFKEKHTIGIEKRKAFANLFTNPTLSYYQKLYFDEKLSIREEMSYLEKRKTKNYQSMLKQVFQTEIPFNELKIEGVVVDFTIWPKKRFDQFSIDDFDNSTFNNLFIELLKTNKKISVLTYKTQLSKFIEWLRYKNLKLFEKVRPLYHHDPTLFEDYDIARPFKQIEKETIRKIVLDLAGMKNPENLEIFLFMMFSAMRISEVVFLKAGDFDIENNYILLEKTKAKKPRKVYINEDLKQLIKIKSIDFSNPEQQIWKLTRGGFERNFRTSMKRLGLAGKISMHTFRKQAISQQIMSIKTNEMVVAKILGLNVRTIERLENQIKNPSVDSIKEIMDNAGHSESRITFQHYFSEK